MLSPEPAAKPCAMTELSMTRPPHWAKLADANVRWFRGQEAYASSSPPSSHTGILAVCFFMFVSTASRTASPPAELEQTYYQAL
ncbi:hypothetical protein BDZ91DRAFT_736134, partial [Kalaharituber pfeilii]